MVYFYSVYIITTAIDFYAGIDVFVDLKLPIAISTTAVLLSLAYCCAYLLSVFSKVLIMSTSWPLRAMVALNW